MNTTDIQRTELPPRARRIRRFSDRAHPMEGTTSACAENTITKKKEPCFTRNYLRVRGEYLESRESCSVTPELPPRARRIP